MIQMSLNPPKIACVGVLCRMMTPIPFYSARRLCALAGGLCCASSFGFALPAGLFVFAGCISGRASAPPGAVARPRERKKKSGGDFSGFGGDSTCALVATQAMFVVARCFSFPQSAHRFHTVRHCGFAQPFYRCFYSYGLKVLTRAARKSAPPRVRTFQPSKQKLPIKGYAKPQNLPM